MLAQMTQTRNTDATMVKPNRSQSMRPICSVYFRGGGAVSFETDMLAAFEQGEPQQINTWGVVVVASPLQVRLAGDDAAIRVEQKNAAYTPTAGHKVKLARVGTQWVVEYQIGAA